MNTISLDKRNIAIQLIFSNSQDGQELEDLLSELESADDTNADELIERLSF